MTPEQLAILQRIETKMDAHTADMATLMERVENMRSDAAEAKKTTASLDKRINTLEHWRTGLMARVSLIAVFIGALGSILIAATREAVAAMLR